MQTIQTLFENDDFIAVHKPEGLASIPECGGQKKSLLQLLPPLFKGKLFVVHRLDKEASGVILFAKNASAHKYLNDCFSGRDVRKTYIALVHGSITESRGRIEKPLREFGSGRMGVDPLRGKPSLTEYQVVERDDNFTTVNAFPVTGRRHQIRVHFYSIGHPLVGDRRYGEKSVQEVFPRLMLHAQELSFRLATGKDVVIEAPIPESFTSVVASVRGLKTSR